MMPVGPSYSQFQQCPTCGGASQSQVNSLQQQLSDMIVRNSRLEEELRREKETTKNQQGNVAHLESRANELAERARLTEQAAGEKWKMVALALDMPIPERAESLAYQGLILYTAEYVIDCVTKVRAKVTVYEEIIQILRGQLAIKEQSYATQLRQIGKTLAGGLLALEAPDILTDEDGQ